MIIPFTLSSVFFSDSSPPHLSTSPNPNEMMMMMMMSFYRKSLHFFLSFADTHHHHHLSSPNYSKSNSHFEQQHAFLAAAGLGGLLINSYSNENDNAVQMNSMSRNILESSSVLNLPDLSAYSSSSTVRKDPRGSGFIDDLGGAVVDGLMSCTESLGFESSDERLVNDNHHEVMIMMEDAGHGHGHVHDDGGCSLTVRRRRRRVVERKFPPPLTSLNQHGHPNFYLRPVRKDGRLELTEIRIERPEILRACREDGRLRLQLIKENDDDHNNQIVEEEEEEEEQEDEKVAEGLVKEGKMEFRRCVEMVNHQHRREHHRGHHHQHLDLWRQHCVTTS